tara:strand:- start:133 stop:309 length:177 start_codon:yes stop_codon:yes gene_type:complete
MGRLSSKVLKKYYSQNQFISPIPPHLTPEEQAEWEKEIKWEKQEHERRKRQGYYPYEN